MVIRVTFQKRSLYIFIVLFVVLATTIFAFYFSKKPHTESRTQYYYHQLGELKNQVSSVDSLISKKLPKEPYGSNLADQLNVYEQSLTSMLDNCSQMNEQSIRDKADPKTKTVQERIDQINRLCADLSKVAEYARSQTRQTQDFLLFQSSTNYDQATLSRLQQVLEGTKSSLEQLRLDPLNDPAVPELLTLVNQLQQETQAASNDSSKLTSLEQKVQQQQANFYNARAYFWKNTIDIAALESSVEKLQTQFK